MRSRTDRGETIGLIASRTTCGLQYVERTSEDGSRLGTARAARMALRELHRRSDKRLRLRISVVYLVEVAFARRRFSYLKIRSGTINTTNAAPKAGRIFAGEVRLVNASLQQ
jgi:hypothetical protein